MLPAAAINTTLSVIIINPFRSNEISWISCPCSAKKETNIVAAMMIKLVHLTRLNMAFTFTTYLVLSLP